MTKPILAITLAISTCMTSACGPAPAPELKVFVSGAARDAFNDLAPQFERATGYKIKAEFDLPPALMRRIGAGEPFDVVILSRGIDELIEHGKVAPDSRVALGRTGVGVAIHRGTPTPDIATVDAFKYTLLRARSITYSGEGSSGQYFLSLLDRLQLANAVKPKLRQPSGSGGAAKILAKGEAELAVIGLPSVIGVDGIDWIGWVPDELQSWIVFAGGMSTGAADPAAAHALLQYLTTSDAAAVFKSRGFEPVLR